MELQFENSVKSCLHKLTCQTQTREETQDIRLPENMPDIGKVIGCWGQILIRGKEWRSDGIGVSGGVMTWVLYAPEDGTEPRCMESWIPFQMKWDIPEANRDGFILAIPTLKSMDARTTSARKILVRVSVSIHAQAMEPMDVQIPMPGTLDPDIQLLTQVYPTELPVEYGEKQFSIDEEMSIPNTYPKVNRIINYALSPQITEYKVMASRLVFRGIANLKILYCAEDGTLHRWETSVPFSQFTELDHDHSSHSSADIAVVVTGLELDKGESDQFTLKSSLAVQYVIYDREIICIAEDVYGTKRKVTAKTEICSLPVRLDDRTEICNITAETNTNASSIVDVCLRMDHPTHRQIGDTADLEIPCQFQILYYDLEGKLQATTARTDAKIQMGCASSNSVSGYVCPSVNIQSTNEGETISLLADTYIHVSMCTNHGIKAVCGLDVGDMKKPDPNRPSVILRRAGEDRLWDIAKEYGSTVEAIREANHLQSDPTENQMLLIPLC